MQIRCWYLCSAETVYYVFHILHIVYNICYIFCLILLFRYIMELYSRGSITTKTIQLSISGAQSILQSSLSDVNSEVEKLCNLLPNDLPPEICSQVEIIRQSVKRSASLFHGLETEHQRLKFLRTQGLILPNTYTLGQIETANPDGGKMLSDATAEYVSIIDTLLPYHQRQSALSQSRPGIVQSYSDTESFKDSEYYQQHPAALTLILYHDDIEVGNALGSRAGVHKLTMFYVAVEGFTDGKLSSIHLSIVCHASDLERFGYGPIMRPLIADLEMLYGGVEVTLENGTECVIHAKLEHLSADNLAANQILGMNRSFSKGHYCRFCYANADLCAVMVSPDHCLCRSPAGYLSMFRLLLSTQETQSKLACERSLHSVTYHTSRLLMLLYQTLCKCSTYALLLLVS